MYFFFNFDFNGARLQGQIIHFLSDPILLLLRHGVTDEQLTTPCSVSSLYPAHTPAQSLTPGTLHTLTLYHLVFTLEFMVCEPLEGRDWARSPEAAL